MTKASEKIFVIDDEKGMCDSLTTLLSGEGYDVKSFQISSEAADAIRNDRVDLVLSDIKMPDMDGLEILKVVREVDDEIPVILMTGFASIDSAVDAVSLGAYDYLMKPVEFVDLSMAVKRAMDKRRTDLSRRQLLEELKLSNMILNRRVGELNALYEAGKSIGSAVHLRDLLTQILTLASAVTEAQMGSIMLLDETMETLKIEAAIGLDAEVVNRTSLPIGESIAGYVAKTGEPLIITDVENDTRFQRMNREKYGAASLLCVPLKIKNKVIGVINMANKQAGQTFSEMDFKMLTTFASQAAVAVDDANQFEKNRRQLLEFEILHEISSELSNIQSINKFRKELITKLQRVFPVDYSIWFHWDSGGNILVPKGATGAEDIPVTESGGIDLGKIRSDVLTLGPFEIADSVVNDIGALSAMLAEKLSSNSNYPKPKHAFMAIPVTRDRELTHVLCLGHHGDRAYSSDDVSLARLVVSQSAILIERERVLLNSTRLLTMGNMISEISHDLRKPLTLIKGGLQVIRQRWPDQAESSDFFKMAEDEIRRMNELVRELVDFSNPNKYQTERIDLRKLVNRAAELVGPDMRKKKIIFEADFAEAEWEVATNKNQVLEMLLNIYMNSIDAMPDGGKLQVNGLIEKPDHKKVDYLAIRVVDTGIGIRPENLSKIFDRYYTSKEYGTGLGLAVVERIISAHGGTLAVRSKAGEGTALTLYFPLEG